MYAKEDQLALLLNFFSFVSLTLSYMGLFAIFSLQVLQKTKEMSIRKVLGANPAHLLKSATRSYFIIALMVFMTAAPVAWFLLRKWLDGFSYKIEMSPVTFIISVCLILILSFIALSYHVIKVVNINPINSLKHE